MSLLRVAKNREVLWPIKVSVPIDGGKLEEVSAKVRYKLLNQDEMGEWASAEMEMLRDSDDIEKALARISPQALAERRAKLAERITGWEEIVDDDSGEPIPFSHETLLDLLTAPYIYAGFHRGLLDASRGAVAKN